MAKDRPTSIRLSRELKADLIRYAKAQGCSLMWLVEYALNQYVLWRKAQEKKK